MAQRKHILTKTTDIKREEEERLILEIENLINEEARKSPGICFQEKLNIGNEDNLSKTEEQPILYKKPNQTKKLDSNPDRKNFKAASIIRTNDFTLEVETIAREIFGIYFEKYYLAICCLPTEFIVGVTWSGISQSFNGKYRFPKLMKEFKSRLEESNLSSTEFRAKRGLLVKRNFNW